MNDHLNLLKVEGGVTMKRKFIQITMLASVPLTMTGCSELFVEEDWSAYEECQYEVESTGIQLDCDDEDSDWYKMKGYKSKVAKSKYAKPSSFGSGKSGFGSGGGSFFGG